MDLQLIKRTTAKFTAADFSPENARYQVLADKLAQVEAAAEKANERRTEISRTLAEWREPAGADIAAALLDGKSPTEATSTRSSFEELRAEREALSSAISVLNAQARELHLELQAARDGSLHRVRPDAQAVLDSLIAEASKHAQAIVDVFASVEAISVGMRCGTTEASAARKAVDGLTGGGALLRYHRTLPVRPEIIAMIEALSDKGPAVRVTKLTEITAP